VRDYEPSDRVHDHGGLLILFWPWGKYSFVGLLTSVLSGVSLWFFVSAHQPYSLLKLLIDSYNQLVSHALGWLTLLIEKLILSLNIAIKLNPDWKHAFIILILYFSAGAWAEFKAGHATFAIVRGTVGIAIALVASILLGSITITQTWLPNFLIAFIPSLSTALNDTLLVSYRSIYLNKGYKTSLHWILIRTSLCILIAAATSMVLKNSINSGFVALIFVIGIHIVNQIRLAFVEVKLWKESSSSPWYNLFLQSKSGLMALRMTSVILWIAVTLLLDVGWENTPWA